MSSSFSPPVRVLLGPGPSDVHPRVLAAMSRPVIGHLDPDFLALMDETQALLRQVFRTQNSLTFTVPGTGMAGMEAALVNLVEPGDPVLVCIQGAFGGRMADIAARAGAKVITIERPFGEVFQPDEVRKTIQRVRPKVVAIVHAETSTGALQPVDDIARAAHESDALILIDTVTSLGGVPVELDAWQIDVAYSGSQKCLGAPPGLSPVSFSPRALERIAARKTKVQSFYLDMALLERYWGSERLYHHTAPCSLIYAMREALALVMGEGLDARVARHAVNAQAFTAGLSAMGLGYHTVEGHRLPQLHCVRIPDGVDDMAVRRRLLADWGIEIGGGLGALKGKAWRIGLMGYSSRRVNVTLLLGALETCLRNLGHQLQPSAAIEAADEVYARNESGR